MTAADVVGAEEEAGSKWGSRLLGSSCLTLSDFLMELGDWGVVGASDFIFFDAGPSTYKRNNNVI